MQITDELNSIEQAASKKGLTMTEACVLAGVAYTAWWRWKSAKAEPKLSSLSRLRDAIDAAQRKKKAVVA